MPPMAFQGVVSKVGFMNKTATVTVSRWVVHKITGKVRASHAVVFFWVGFLKFVIERFSV
jgi:hypothetical protein